MADKIKKIIVFIFLVLTLVSFPYNISYGIYFGVLTNVLINVFWTANLFCFDKKTFNKSKKQPLGFSVQVNKKAPRRPFL
jgi:hypothetical protein